MKKRKNIIAAVILLMCCVAASLKAEVRYATTSVTDIPFDMPRVALPDIPANTVCITDFGAVGDGGSLCTEAFAKAMQALAAKGGGRLVVPAGIWLTGPIQFENCTELHLERGALLLFTSDFDAYPNVSTVYEGNTANKKMAPLWAYRKHDIAITGDGAVDAQGERWRPSKQGKFTANQWKELTSGQGIAHKGVWYPDAKQDDEAGKEGKPDFRRVLQRPVLLEFAECQRVLLQDVTLSNSPAWNTHPLKCEDVTIDHVTIRNPWYAQNGDGLDLESCNRCIIKNSTFDVGDDAICIKSGKDKEGRAWKMPCQNVIIEGCTVLHGHGGFVIGSEMSSGARNIYVYNCLFNGTDTGLRMKSTRGRGGVVEKIYVDKINMVNIAGEAFTFSLYYANKPVAGKQDGDTSSADAVPPVTEETPCFRDLHISNITCQGARRAVYFNGLPEMPLSDVVLENSLFVCDEGADMHYAKNITFKNVKIQQKRGERITMADVKNFKEK
ncbi:MAG: glycoside hydrolase family 28 protein [Prevotella sp.]|nr:glycoside hydrolase family 28 protein [Prevotella sp.]